MFVCLFGFLTSSSTTRLYRGRAPRQERLTILRAATHETELGDHDFCLSRSHYTDTDPTCKRAGGHSGDRTRDLLTRSRRLYRRATAPPVLLDADIMIYSSEEWWFRRAKVGVLKGFTILWRQISTAETGGRALMTSWREKIEFCQNVPEPSEYELELTLPNRPDYGHGPLVGKQFLQNWHFIKL